ncbi:MAG: hypothetical protein JXA37_08865 [Chloroflexia bacterium]|nr:hypothetical protein [Chloroflexia bacterium]
MSTERLYYDDPTLLSFEARVVARRQSEGRPAVVLDRSAFYPTSGGQPHDTGTLRPLDEPARRVAVVDVLEQDGDVVHVLDGGLPGEAVRGQVDGQRRFDHMQQHTGQHILSQVCSERYQAETVSFHLGADYCSIDLDRSNLTAEDVVAIEERANAIIFEDRPVRARFVQEHELAHMPLRKPPLGYDRVRIVEVEGLDWSPCGGTHCARTGQVGHIRLIQLERRGKESRLSFLCGWRALRDARWKHDLLRELAGRFTVGLPDLPDAVARLAEAEETARKGLERARQDLLHYEAQERYAQAERVGPARLVSAVLNERSLDELRLLAREIAALPGGVALLGLGGETARLCFVRHEDLSGDMGALVRQAAAVLGGRGGGRPQEAQGGGPDAGRLEEALEEALAGLRDLLTKDG